MYRKLLAGLAIGLTISVVLETANRHGGIREVALMNDRDAQQVLGGCQNQTCDGYACPAGGCPPETCSWDIGLTKCQKSIRSSYTYRLKGATGYDATLSAAGACGKKKMGDRDASGNCPESACSNDGSECGGEKWTCSTNVCG